MKSPWWLFPVHPPHPTPCINCYDSSFFYCYCLHTPLPQERVTELMWGLAWVTQHSEQGGQPLQKHGRFLKCPMCHSFQCLWGHLALRTELQCCLWVMVDFQIFNISYPMNTNWIWNLHQHRHFWCSCLTPQKDQLWWSLDKNLSSLATSKWV